MEQNEVIYRKAEERDFEAILYIWTSGIKFTFSNYIFPENIEREFYQIFLQRTEHFNFWVAQTQKDKITSYCSVLPCTQNPIKRNTIGELSVYSNVDISEISNSLGLISFVIQELKTSSIKHLIAFSREDNLKGISLLKKVGFKINEPLKFDNYFKYFLSANI